MQSILHRQRSFQRPNCKTHGICSVMATEEGSGAGFTPSIENMTEEDINDMKNVFNLFDTNNSGAIIAQKLGATMRAAGELISNPADVQLQEMIRQLDNDNSGVIDLEKFSTMMYQTKLNVVFMNVTEVEINEIKKAPGLSDADNSGAITAPNRGLDTSMQAADGMNPTEAELLVQHWFMKLQNGVIDFEKLCIMMHLDELSKLFSFFDRDGNGIISAADLKTAMCDLGEILKDSDVVDMVRVADLDGDGVIDFYEFMVMKTRELFDRA